MKTLLALAALLALASAAISQQCWGPVLRSTPVGVADVYDWHQRDDDPDRVYLFKNNKQIGGYCTSENVYRAYNAGVWSDPCKAPVEVPQRYVVTENFGVDLSKIDGHSYKVNGNPVDKNTAYAIMEDKLVDDSNKLRVTIFGSEQERKKVKADLAGEDLSFAIVRDYPPDHWVATTAGFYTEGSPTIYCQAPSGKVLHRQDDYSGGKEKLVGALRKAKDSYDYKDDPDLRKPRFNLPSVDISNILSYLGAALAGIFGADYLGRKK